MILAAGLGTRMRPLSGLRAKPALPVLNRPLLHYTLEALHEIGVREVVINTHHRPASIRRAVGDGRELGMRVRYSHEPRLLGSIGGVRKLRRFFGDEPLLLLNGDMVFDFDLRRLISSHRRARAVATVSLQPFPKRGSYRAVVTDARGRIRCFGGYPRPARGRAWHFTGVQLIEPRILDRLTPGYAETARDLYGPLLEEGALLLGVPLAGPWYDLSSPPLYLASQMELLEQGFGATRQGCCIDPSARIGSGARIRSAVIGARCVIGARAVVAESVLWKGVRVGARARVERSIATDRVRLRAGAALRSAIALPRRRLRLPR
jgi:NDP-sugar pyrophosphorylase family protein